MTAKYARRAGGRWRFQAYRMDVRDKPQMLYGDPIQFEAAEFGPNEFDELVVGSWIHLEQMDTGVWWMRLGGTHFTIRVDRDGRCVRVTDYDGNEYAAVEQ